MDKISKVYCDCENATPRTVKMSEELFDLLVSELQEYRKVLPFRVGDILYTTMADILKEEVVIGYGRSDEGIYVETASDIYFLDDFNRSFFLSRLGAKELIATERTMIAEAEQALQKGGSDDIR